MLKRPLLVLIAALLVVFALVLSMRQPARRPANAEGSQAAEPTSVRLFCAASNRAVVEAIRREYEEECGRQVEIEYGPSQTLLSAIAVSGQGDLYLPADDSYLDLGHEQGLLAEQIPLASMRLVLCVPKGNPLGIDSFDDLLRDGLRVVQAQPDAAAVAKMTRRLLTEQDTWEALEGRTMAFRSTVTEVASDVKLGAADVGIVFDAVLHTFPDLEAVALPEFSEGVAHIGVAVIKDSTQPAAALHFARYLAAKDRGAQQYKEHGFQPVDGDAWADVPEVSIYAGSMLRPAIEQTLVDFEQREGVQVTRVYNGCGILVAQMQGGRHPDAYFACDVEFMNQVREMFPEPVNVSGNELVILVQEGNPHGIRELKDLSRPGLRVGIGHEKQCAMGWLTQQTLTEGGVQ
ncbi:MAG: molybdate ABC transporter substrate-binding protein, partial [Planctomycetaceae bacterium]|nr:molybdate ABC transporter substrate-binding protein [Planctomycetaceae bacterium]